MSWATGEGCPASLADDLYKYENCGADDEVNNEAPVFYEQRMVHGARKVRHQQEIDGVAGQHGEECVDETAECFALRHRFVCACAVGGKAALHVAPSEIAGGAPALHVPALYVPANIPSDAGTCYTGAVHQGRWAAAGGGSWRKNRSRAGSVTIRYSQGFRFA